MTVTGMEKPQTPLLARINWYWILQGLGWGSVTAFLMLVNGPFLARPGAVLACILDGVSGLVLTDLWRRYMKLRDWNTRRVDWRQVLVAIFILGPLQLALVTIIARSLVGVADGGSWLPMLLLFWSGIMAAWIT